MANNSLRGLLDFLTFKGYNRILNLPKLKPRWDVHLSDDDDQLGYAGESLSSVLGE